MPSSSDDLSFSEEEWPSNKERHSNRKKQLMKVTARDVQNGQGPKKALEDKLLADQSGNLIRIQYLETECRRLEEECQRLKGKLIEMEAERQTLNSVPQTVQCQCQDSWQNMNSKINAIHLMVEELSKGLYSAERHS